MDHKQMRPEWIPSGYVDADKKQPTNEDKVIQIKTNPGNKKTHLIGYRDRKRRKV